MRSGLGRWAVALTLIVLPACSTAESGASRANCRPADDFAPSLADAAAIFEAISPDYIDRAFPRREDRPLPLDRHEVEINALSAPTIVLVLTSQHRLAKLLAQRDGKDLLIRKSVSYPFEAAKTRDWKGQPASEQNIRVAEGKAVDLDPSGGDALAAKEDIRWQSDEGRPSTLVIRPATAGSPGTYWAQVKSLVVVPVIAHRMKSRQHADDVKQAFSNKPSAPHRPEDMLSLANDKVDKSMNAVWAPAGILFYLHRLEDCEYSLDDFPMQPPPNPAPAATSDEVMSWPMGDCQSRFRLVNSAYNTSDVRGLDLYLWAKMDRAAGYASPHKNDWPSPGPGAVWLDRTCREGAVGVPRCDRLLAHETGHFLRVCHVCVTPKQTPPEDRGKCGFCPGVRPECSTAHTGLLMRDDLRFGDDPTDTQKIPLLTVQEIRDARKEAWQRAGGK